MAARSRRARRRNALRKSVVIPRSSRVFVWVFLSVVIERIEASPARMTVSKMRAEDLESSASGYMYNQQQGLPVYYLHYTDHGSGSYYHTPDAVAAVAGAQYVAAPVAPNLQPYAAVDKGTRQEIVTYANHQLPDHVALPVKSKPRAPYYFEKTLEEMGNEADKTHDSKEEHEEDSHENEEDYHPDEYGDSDEDIDGDSDHSSEESDVGYGKGHGEFYGSHGSRDGGSASEDVSGEKYATQEYSKNGEDGDEAYKSRRQYSKGGHGAHDNEHSEGYYSENDKREKGHVDEGEGHGSHQEAVKGEKGSNYGHSSYHKKGDKTKGYHNVYHKDEYKKETDFYDEDHEKGYFDKFEKFDKGFKGAEGEFKKGDHHSSGHDHEDSGKKGYYDEGRERSQDRGHRTEEGEKSYHSNHGDYAVKGGSKSEKEDKFHKDSDYH